MADIVVADITPRDQYTAGGGGPTVFAYTFPVFEQTDINVYRTPNGAAPNDVTQILIYNVDYTVVINPAPDVGGAIILATAANPGDVITIVRNQPYNYLDNFIDGGLFEATQVNTAFDQSVMMSQQDKMYNRVVGVHYNLSANPVNPNDTVLPVLPANCVWIKSSDGTAIQAQQVTTINPYSVALPTTDNAVARFDGTAGSLQNSGVIIDDANNLFVGNLAIGGNSISTTNVNGNINLASSGSGSIVILSKKSIKFNNIANTSFTSLKAGANIANYEAVLPIEDGAPDTVMVTDGGGNWSFAVLTGTPATKAQMEAAVNGNAAVTPVHMQDHPGVAKAWVNFTPGTPPIINGAYNVDGVTKNADGDYTISFNEDFADVNYVMNGGAQYNTAGSNSIATVIFANVATPNLVGSCRIQIRDETGNLFLPTLVTCTFFGTQ